MDQPKKKINHNVVETLLRIAISDYHNAIERVDVIRYNQIKDVDTRGDYLLAEASVSALDAVSFLQEWAELNDVVIRDRMKT